MKVYTSIKTECDFCGWKKKKSGQNPIVRFSGTKVFAFCPMCNLEIEVSEQEIDGPSPSDFVKQCKDREKLIEHALGWLDENEPKWQLDEPIDREKFIKDILERANYGDK